MQRSRTLELLRLFRRPDAGAASSFVPALRTAAGGAADVSLVLERSVPAAAARSAARGEGLPLPLRLYRPARADQLGAAARQALAKLFQNLPRPRETLDEVLRLACAGARAQDGLVSLIETDEALVRELRAAAQASGAGGDGPAADVAQAVERLGSARACAVVLCRLLGDHFGSGDAQRQRLIENTRHACRFACELALRLGEGLRFAAPAGLVGQTALTFVGRLATIACVPGSLLAKVPPRGLLERSTAEQALLGLSSAEIGRWLMQQWGLPAALADEAAEIDAVLFAPFAAWDPPRASRLALCYLSARLGERLAYDADFDLGAFDLLHDADPELHQLRGYLAQPAFAGVTDELGRGEVRAAIRALRG